MRADVDLDALPISETLRVLAHRIINHKDSDPEVHIANFPEYFPSKRLAAVLVLLYERDGMVRVLLTTRSKHLRSHPGQVALPGGKSDPEDGTPFATALREANEEVSLPLSSPHIHVLCTMPPFPSLYKLIVTPVVALLSDISILETLRPNPGEVDEIFDHPLEAFLDPSIMLSEPKLSPRGGEQWFYDEELRNFSDHAFIAGEYRNNRLRSTTVPIKGLTSSVLIHLATIAYARPPTYEPFAPGALPISEVIAVILEEARTGKVEDVRVPYRNPVHSPGPPPFAGLTRENTPVVEQGKDGGRGGNGEESEDPEDMSGDTISVLPA